VGETNQKTNNKVSVTTRQIIPFTSSSSSSPRSIALVDVTFISSLVSVLWHRRDFYPNAAVADAARLLLVHLGEIDGVWKKRSVDAGVGASRASSGDTANNALGRDAEAPASPASPAGT
jgi:hypothetical protein